MPLAVKKKWNQQLERYLQYRESLRGLVMLMDIRHPLTDPDRQMLGWAVAADMPVHILLTKADKLKRGPAQNTLLSVRSELAAHAELVSVQCFSSLKRPFLHRGFRSMQAIIMWAKFQSNRELGRHLC